MADMADEILVEVFGEGDRAEQDRMAQELRRELLQVREVEAVDPAVSGPAPPGSKGLEIAAIGAVLVQVAGNVDAISKLVKVALGWFNRKPAGKAMRVTINGQTIEFTPDAAQQAEMMRAFIDAAQAGPAATEAPTPAPEQPA